MLGMGENAQAILERFLCYISHTSHLVPRDFSQVLVFLFVKYDVQKDENSSRCALKI